jgi:hypothetical protein
MSDKPSIYYVLLSRKFWMAVIGLILVLITAWSQEPYPTDAVVTAIMGVVAAYIGSVALEDGMSKQAEAKAQTTTVSTPGESDVTVTAPSDTYPGRHP